MPVQSVTLNLPEPVYEQIQRAAVKTKRRVDEIMAEAVAAVAPVMDSAPQNLRSVLAQMAYLNDAALWQAARATMTIEQRERLQYLHDKQQREKLTVEEQAEEQALVSLYRETLLIRAQAAVILKRRGYSIVDPKQFAPIE
jgi:uncharacterized protein YnzC (UPF0291/DUF896 family)